MRMTDAAGTIMGERNIVRNVLLYGIFVSSRTARASESITTSGTAVREKIPVFFSASLKAELLNSFMKLSSPTKFAVDVLSMTE